jgi:Prophage CP4-57 regulatory protein (AlpA)
MKLVRYKQLHDEGIIPDRMALARKIENEGFPKAIAMGPNTLCWDYDEVLAWIAARPRRAPKTGAKKPTQSANAASAEA